MPWKSKAQAKLMLAAEHDPAFAKRAGVPVSVAQEFNQASQGRGMFGQLPAKAKNQKSKGGKR